MCKLLVRVVVVAVWFSIVSSLAQAQIFRGHSFFTRGQVQPRPIARIGEFLQRVHPASDVRQIDDGYITNTFAGQQFQGHVYSSTGPFKRVDGNAKLVVIVVTTEDVRQLKKLDERNKSYFEDIVFNDLDSAANYFDENSWGEFTLTNKVVARANLDKPLTDERYKGGFPDNQELYDDILKKAKIDWASLDQEPKDNKISKKEAQILILYARKNNGDSGSKRDRGAVEIGDITVRARPVAYVRANTEAADRADNPIKVQLICHELGHAIFNLADRRYSRTVEVEVDGEVITRTDAIHFTGQPYDLMSNGQDMAHINIHDKMKLGWIQPRILTPRNYPGLPLRLRLHRRFLFTASERSPPSALILFNPNRPNEYWIVENRYKPASRGDFNRGIPNADGLGGIAIWWVRVAAFADDSYKDGQHHGGDDVRLVDASQGDIDPDGSGVRAKGKGNPRPIDFDDPGYVQQTGGALFKDVGVLHRRQLLFSDGTVGFEIRFVSGAANSMLVRF